MQLLSTLPLGPVTTSTSGSSCDSICLGLVIGIVLVVVLVIAVVVFVVWKRRHPSSAPSCLQSQDTSSTPENKQNTTVVHVVNNYDDISGYASPESVIPSSQDPDYLHLDFELKPSDM